jgi:flagellar biosynthesis/type III secretory pathway M-ring protein FliF/YscJ
MDVQEARKFFVRHWSSVLVILLVILVVISLTWNVRQYRLIKRERERTIATERAKAEREAAEAARTQTRREKKADEAAANQRMQQLYREIDNLSQISDRLLTEPVRQPKVPSTVDSLEGANGPP